MTTARNTDPIKKITTKSGEVRYRFIIDVGKRPDGRRDQRCFTFRTIKEARAERSKIIADRSRGTLERHAIHSRFGRSRIAHDHLVEADHRNRRS